MKISLVGLLVLIFVVLKINDLAGQNLEWSTQSDSCLFYYFEGWKAVMEKGNYQASEKAYRKMHQFDPDFLIGKALLGRISTNLAEQQDLLQSIEDASIQALSKGEKWLLPVYKSLLKLMIVRQTNPDQATEQIKMALTIGEENLAAVVQSYPDAYYATCEYVEILHYNRGPQKALEYLSQNVKPAFKERPFLLGYAAIMEAEIGQFTVAFNRAKQLKKMYPNNSNVPKPYVVLASIYYKKGNLNRADRLAKKALKLDPMNVDAQRLLK